MADFSALKTSIQNYIKQNGNEEITGNLLQQVLLSMVNTLGDSAINDLVTALNNEVSARQNADGTLQGNINTLQGNINTLQGVVNGIKANIDNGYVYAGIANPSTTPASGKVFYLALTAGTYTNFGATVVPQGINILKYNGSAWSLDSFLGLDNAPTQGSNNLVKSGGVLDSIIKDGSAFDLSAYNSGTTYADLSAALTALNALPAAYKKGGMSMKFVHTSDNKYVQYRLMAQNFTTDVTQWQGVDAVPTAGSKNLVESGGVREGLNDYSDTIIVSSFLANSSEHSSNIDFIDVSKFVKRYVDITISCGTATTSATYCALYFKQEDGSNISNSAIPIDTALHVLIPNNCKYISFYIYPVTRFGTFNVRVEDMGRYGRYAHANTTLYINTTDNTIRTSSTEVGFFGFGASISKPNGTTLSCNIYETASSIAQIVTNGVEMKPIIGSKPIEEGYCIIAIIITNYTTDLSAKQFKSILWSGCDIEVDGVLYPASVSSIKDALDTLAVYYNKKIDLAKEYDYSVFFKRTSSEHSSASDLIYADLHKGDRIDGVITLQNTTWNGSSLRMVFRDALGTTVQQQNLSSIQDGFSIVIEQDAVSVGCYMYALVGEGEVTIKFNIVKRDERLYNSNTIPAHFKSQVESLITNHTEDIANIGINGDNFVFITDIHWSTNQKNSPSLIRHICKRCPIKLVVFGGDAINGGTISGSMLDFREVAQSIASPDNINLISVCGNHDYNSFDGGVRFPNGNGVFRALFQRDSNYIVEEKTDGAYFYFDNKGANTRYIVLETPENYFTETFNQEQIGWLEDVLTNTPSTEHIIIFMHLYLSSLTQKAMCSATLESIIEHSGKQVECIIVGHAHMDYNCIATGGIPVVITDCDGFPKAKNTITEQAFDVVSINYTDKIIYCRRIGRGKDRIIHYDLLSLNTTDTLNISSLITIEPTSYSIRDNLGLSKVDGNIVYSSTLASIDSNGVVSPSQEGLAMAVAENDDCIETFNIKIE